MMAALEAKRDDLAFQYARQYARHLRNLQQRSNKVLGLTGLAMEREGLLESNAWHMAPQFQADRSLLEADLAKSAEREAQRTLELDSRAKELLLKAQAYEDKESDAETFGFKDETAKLSKPQEPPLLDEKLERQKIRMALQGKLPVDPQGKVDVYFFFRPRDTRALEMASEINQLYSSRRGSKNVNVVGMTVDTISPAEEAVFKRRTGAEFPLLNGQKLISMLGIKTSPATVFVSQSTGNAHLESGPRKFYYLDEALSIMEGR